MLGYMDPKPTRVLDVGAGTGDMAAIGEERALDWWTLDGDINTHPEILHDFTEGPLGEVPHYDLAWCVEFLEHVEARYLDNVFSALSACDWVICTAAPPGWGGHHHVNEQELAYWVAQFDARGFSLDIEASAGVRAASTMTIAKPKLRGRVLPKPFMRERGMVYKMR